MDWAGAIDKHQAALKRLLALLVAMAGMTVAAGESHHTAGTDVGQNTLPRHLHRAILRLLRPAEAAARRLIILAARGMIVPPPRPRLGTSQQHSAFLRAPGGTGIVMPKGAIPLRPAPQSMALPLLDPLRLPRQKPSRSAIVPRIRGFGFGFEASSLIPARPAPLPDDPLDADRLRLRLAALGRALDDLPRQARRFVRWRQRPRRGAFHRLSPLRGGPPPGLRSPGSRHAREVDRTLDDLHGLALWTLEHPDSS
ncbi:hypothetical protein [Oryzicola mucosus]|uniref:Uncharacterized protein n=1 Tax=Oryzicola mucosus TaxID=2767425 RepID=A0A8J6PJ27_9HYPH|nr:hypothetical protein [Oryzicola mucosus]MBD0415849.1 hypothetical protein [Oryzicola mucosus]